MRLIDPEHPFFAPSWRRWVTTGVPLTWAGVEVVAGNPGWGILFAAAGIYAGYVLLIAGR